MSLLPSPLYRFTRLSLHLAIFTALCAAPQTPAQTVAESSSTPSQLATAVLPDAPAPSDAETPNPQASAQPPSQYTSPEPGRFDKYVYPGQHAPRLTPFDKTLMGLRSASSPYSVIEWFLAATYEQITNGRPNYGQTATGYGQRVGAAVLRDYSEDVFTDAILAPILHEDPRYYKLGSRYSFPHRVVYAVTRPVLTRTDGGSATINFAQIGGNLSGAALTDAYYPPINRTAGATLVTFGTSMGGNALGDLYHEFFPPLGELLHLHRQ